MPGNRFRNLLGVLLADLILVQKDDNSLAGEKNGVFSAPLTRTIKVRRYP